jgi:hypothetical protein
MAIVSVSSLTDVKSVIDIHLSLDKTSSESDYGAIHQGPTAHQIMAEKAIRYIEWPIRSAILCIRTHKLKSEMNNSQFCEASILGKIDT